MILRSVVAVSAAAFLAASVSACGGDDDPVAGTVEEAPTSTTSPTPSPVDEGWTAAVDAIDAVATNRFADARRLVASDSPAEHYVVHQEAMYDAEVAQGFEPPTYLTAASDPSRMVALFDSSGALVLNYADFESDSSGRLVNFSTAGSMVSDRLWTKPVATTVEGVSFRLVSAYASTAGGLSVVIEVTASRVPVNLVGTPTYRDRAGRQTTAADWVGPSELQAHATTLMVHRFPIADIGGTFQMEFWPGDGHGILTLDIR